jgi:hypothetical protein
LELTANATAAEWYSFVGDDSWHSDAHRDDLWLPRTPDEAFARRFDLFVAVLLAVLDRAEAKYDELLSALDRVCAKEVPLKEDIAFAATHLAPGATAVAHVFEMLSPNWLHHLREEAVFKSPPDVHFYEDGSFSFPSWPQAGYLARIAAAIPEEVASTIEQVPIVDNESIHSVFLYAGSRMPPACAARVARHEAPWVGEHRWGVLLAKRLGELVRCLLAGNEVAAALELARRSLGLLPHDDGRPRRGPDARVESWAYAELVRDVVGAFSATDQRRTLDLLYEMLDASSPERRNLGRGPIGGGTRLQANDPFSMLFAQLRNLFEARAAAGALEQSVAELEAKGIALYDRLALHLIRLHGDDAPGLGLERALDQTRLAEAAPDSELALMIRDRFSSLTQADQLRVIDAIRTSTLREEEFEKGSTEAARQQMTRWRLLQWWHALHSKLPADVLEEYRALCNELGEPPSDRTEVWFGPTAPMGASELATRSDDELIAYLREWTPPESRLFESSREGLGREVQTCAKQDPTRFSRLARAFVGLDAPYVSNLLWGLHDAVKVDADGVPKAIDWPSIRMLLSWAATQLSRGWEGARTMAIKVAEDCIASSPDAHEQRLAWSVVQSLMIDADPNERDASYAEDYEVERFAINTVRGQAMEAAIRCGEHIKSTQPESAHQQLLAEVLAEIRLRASAEHEPCTAIRSVIARRFNNIYLLSREVATSIAAQLFPNASDNSSQRRILWRSFVLSTEAHSTVFAILRESYQIAVASIADEESEVAGNVGEHLAFLVLCNPSNTDCDQLLGSFVDRATAQVRHLALQEVGRSVHHTNGASEADVSRIKAFWESWAARVQAKEDRSDLQAFGWWFTSALFETDWAFQKLADALEATAGRVDWDHAVVQKLRERTALHPSEVAACLGKLIDGPDQWWAARHESTVQSILAGLRRTAAADRAREMSSRLVARGHSQFRIKADPVSQ